MKIISNNCISGFLYKSLRLPCNHPFFWNLIHLDDFITLVDNYETIDFNNVELKCEQGLKKFKLVIDNKITLNKNHYIFSPNDIIPRECNNNIYYNKIWEYIINEYNKRLLKMTNEKPVFILHNDIHCDDFKDQNYFSKIEKLVNICNDKHIKLIFIGNIDIPFNETNYFKKIIFDVNKKFNSYPEDMIKLYKDKIKTILLDDIHANKAL